MVGDFLGVLCIIRGPGGSMGSVSWIT